LRYDLLIGNYVALHNDLKNTPESVLQDPQTVLLIAIDRLLNQPEKWIAPKWPEAGDDDKYRYTPENRNRLYVQVGNYFRQHEQYEQALRVYSI
jgi:hypothetical protein